MKSKYELIQGECLEKMQDIKPESVNLILCDLPYGTTDRHGINKNKDGGENRIYGWDNIIPIQRCFGPIFKQNKAF